jgi:hypothetical protein
MSRTFRPLAVALVAAAAGPAPAVEPLDLLKYAPARANAVVVINLDLILASPRAAKEGWGKLDHTEYLAGAIPLNPQVAKAVIVKEIDPHAAARGEAFAVLATRRPVDLDSLVRTTRGEAGTAGGEPVVVSPRGSVLVPLGAEVLGVAWTDNRQEVGRWVRAAKAATASPLGKFLNVSTYNSARHHILIALDTEDLFDARDAAVAVGKSKALEGNKAAAAGVEGFLASLRGVALTIEVTADGLAAVARFDSAPLKKADPQAFKAFVVELLAHNGALLEDLPAAEATAAEGSVTLKFKLSDPELAHLMGLFVPPVPNLSPADVRPVAPGGVSAEATRKYVRAVNRVLDDLRKRTGKGTDYQKMATWQDSAANRIETVSVLNVDPQAVGYGAGTAARLRAVADSLRGVPVRVANLQGQMYAWGYRPGGAYFTPRGRLRYGFGWGAVGGTNAGDIALKQSEVVQKDAENRAALWAEIESQRALVRREMAEKHKIETEEPAKK